MAIPFYCSSLLSPPKSPGFSPWRQLFPRKSHIRGNDAAAGLSVTQWTLPKELYNDRFFSEIHIFGSGETSFHLFRPVLGKDLQNLSVNQVTMGAMVIRFPAIALLLTNALSLALPFEALAQTCEADNSFFNMPLLLLVALIGATVGGLLARQRRGELKRLNEQLRQINAALRKQAKIESYAPTLSYAPVGGRIPETEVVVDPQKQELITRLKGGKNYLRNQEPGKAFMEFKEALKLAQNLNDPIEEKKAARGLGASLQRQGKYREAIEYHSMVLSISKRVGESSGDTEAYGAIADCYTELGDLEKAAKFYDKYIARLEAD